MDNTPKIGVNPNLVFEEYQEELKKFMESTIKLRAFVRQLQKELQDVKLELANAKKLPNKGE